MPKRPVRRTRCTAIAYLRASKGEQRLSRQAQRTSIEAWAMREGAQANLPANVEVFEGTMYGWCPPDSHVYNHEAAEKAWGELLALLKSALG